MNLQEAIYTRHSIREFEKKKIPLKILKGLVKDACKAPSAANTQPWKFIIVNKKETMEKIRTEYSKFIQIKGFKPTKEKRGNIVYNFYSNLGNCQNIIFVYMEKAESKNWKFHKLLSISASIQNILLSATAIGLGTCWMASFKDTPIENKFKKILKLKKNSELVSGILVGYPRKGYNPWIREKKKLNEILTFV